MDKRIVIAAYRRGFITIQECAQIIGVDSKQMNRLIDEPVILASERKYLKGHSV
jgi:predicted HTH domain antitoxin